MRFGAFITAMICSFCLLAGTASASGFGLRAGFGIDPDQFVAGIQGELSGKKLKAFSLAPSADFGFGDSITTVCVNLDFLMLLGLPNSDASLYGGAGPTLSYWDFDNIANDTEIGLSLVGGARFAMGRKNVYNAEVRFGVGDIPDVRILFGIMFGARRAPDRPVVR